MLQTGIILWWCAFPSITPCVDVIIIGVLFEIRTGTSRIHIRSVSTWTILLGSSSVGNKTWRGSFRVKFQNVVYFVMCQWNQFSVELHNLPRGQSPSQLITTSTNRMLTPDISWNTLSKSSKRKPSDIEPIYIFRKLRSCVCFSVNLRY